MIEKKKKYMKDHSVTDSDKVQYRNSSNSTQLN